MNKKQASLARRKNKQKAKRLEHAAAMTVLRQGLKARRADANVVAVKGQGEVVFGLRTGLFGHPTTTVLKVAHEKIVGATEDVQELGEMVTQLGLLTLGALLQFNLAEGPEALARRFAKWAGIDLEALKTAAEAEAATQTQTVDEDGDIEVRTTEPTYQDESPEAPAETEA